MPHADTTTERDNSGPVIAKVVKGETIIPRAMVLTLPLLTPPPNGHHPRGCPPHE